MWHWKGLREVNIISKTNKQTEQSHPSCFSVNLHYSYSTHLKRAGSTGAAALVNTVMNFLISQRLQLCWLTERLPAYERRSQVHGVSVKSQRSGKVEVKFHIFLTSTSYACEWADLRSGHFNPEEGYHIGAVASIPARASRLYWQIKTFLIIATAPWRPLVPLWWRYMRLFLTSAVSQVWVRYEGFY
jgi:hypothetical protein